MLRKAWKCPVEKNISEQKHQLNRIQIAALFDTQMHEKLHRNLRKQKNVDIQTCPHIPGEPKRQTPLMSPWHPTMHTGGILLGAPDRDAALREQLRGCVGAPNPCLLGHLRGDRGTKSRRGWD